MKCSTVILINRYLQITNFRIFYSKLELTLIKNITNMTGSLLKKLSGNQEDFRGPLLNNKEKRSITLEESLNHIFLKGF